jgi:hypothetical protein
MARLDPANHVLFSSATHVYARLGSRVTAELWWSTFVEERAS